MRCCDIINSLEQLSPKEYALDFDNVGLLVGRKDKHVNKIMIALDATSHVVDIACDEGVDMLITHHPMIFSKIKKITDDDVLGSKILKLAESKISYYAMHTNFDVMGGMAGYAANLLGMKYREVLSETASNAIIGANLSGDSELGLTTVSEGIGRVGVIEGINDCRDVVSKVKEVFNLSNVLVYGDIYKKVKKVAICPGSGKSVIADAIKHGADCLITGDIGHHDGIDAVEMGLVIIDATHFGIEQIFIEYIYNYLNPLCPGVDILKVNEGCPAKMY